MGKHRDSDDNLSTDQLQQMADDFDRQQAEIDARNDDKPQDYPAIRNFEGR